MQQNASKFTGVQSPLTETPARIDVEQIKIDAQVLMQASPAERDSALIRFAQNNRAAMHKAADYAKTHPWFAKAMIGAGTVAAMVPGVAAEGAFGINGTEIDEMFGVLNEHILPNVGTTIGAMPAVIIPIVILIVLIAILMFVPELLYGLMDMLREAFKIRK